MPVGNHKRRHRGKDACSHSSRVAFARQADLCPQGRRIWKVQGARFDSRGDCYHRLATSDPQSSVLRLISLAFSASCRVYVAFNPKATFRLRHLLDVIAPRKQVALDIKRHDDRRMTETFLHDLGRKSKASIIDSFHAPRGVKMPQGRKPLFGARMGSPLWSTSLLE